MTSLTLEEEVEIGLSNEERKVLRDMEHRLALAPDVEEEDRDDLLVESQVPPRPPESSNLSLLLRSQRCCDIVRLSLLNYLVKVGSKPGDVGGLSPLFRQVILDDADHVILDEAQIQSLQFELSNVLKDKLLRHQKIRTRKSLPSQRQPAATKSPHVLARRRSVVPASTSRRGLISEEKKLSSMALRGRLPRGGRLDGQKAIQRRQPEGLTTSGKVPGSCQLSGVRSKRRKPRKSRKLNRLVERLSTETVSSKAKAQHRPKSK